MKKNKIILTVFIVIFILLKLLLVSSQRDAIFDNNEFFSGTLAMELIHGLSLPLKYCVPDNHNFGSIVNGVLIAPFYTLFGPSAASAKMVSILFSLGVLVLWYLLLNRFFNLRVAILASLLFVFSPTIYTKCSVLSIGSHPESNLFTALIMFISYLIFFDNRKKNIYFILLGLSSGFAFFYSYLCGITLLVLFIFWFAFDKKFILRPEFYLFLIFFLIGFSPRVYFASAINPKIGYVGFAGFFSSAFNMKDASFAHIVFKIKDFLTKDLLCLFDFGHFSSFLRYLYYAFFFICFLSLMWVNRYSIRRLTIPFKLKKEKPLSRESVVLLFPFIFFLAYILSRYTIWQGWQNAGYIVPLYPFVFAIVAIGFEQLMHTRYRLMKALSITALSLILLAGFCENIALISFEKIGKGFAYKGYSYRKFGERVSASNFQYNKVVKKIKNMDFSKRKYFLQGFGWGFYNSYNSDKAMVAKGEEFLKKFSFDREDRLHFFKGIGRGIADRAALYAYHKADSSGLNDNVASNLFILKSVAEKDEDLRKYFWKGFGQGSDFLYADKIMVDYVEERFKVCFYEGLGESITERNMEDTSLNWIKKFDPKYLKYVYFGYKERRSELLLRDNGYDE